MSQRKISLIIPALEVTEGAGVSVFRSIGTPPLRNLDPFLMLDQFSTDDPDDYIAGFPEHPHRGFNTFTYMLDGHMQHGDSMGNRGDLGPGGAQWMKAGSGVIHSEMPQQESGRMRGFQLWVNLPAQEKMTPPEYQEVRPESVPELSIGDATVRLLAGTISDHHGPVADPNTDVEYIDVKLAPNSEFVHNLDPELAAFIFLFEGQALVSEQPIQEQQLAVLSEGEKISIDSGKEGARFLLVSGKPIGEPIVQYGPFVMNTREEIELALSDFRAGKLVRKKANMINY